MGLFDWVTDGARLWQTKWLDIETGTMARSDGMFSGCDMRTWAVGEVSGGIPDGRYWAISDDEAGEDGVVTVRNGIIESVRVQP